MGGRPHRTVPPQTTVYANLQYKDGTNQRFNQGPEGQRTVTYERKTLVQSIENSTNTEDGRSPSIDFELPFQEAQATRQQITLPAKLADSAMDQEMGRTREPDDSKKVGVQNKRQGQEFKQLAGRYELKGQVNEEERKKDEGGGEEGDSSYEDDDEAVDAGPDLVREKLLKECGTGAIADSIDPDGLSSNHQSNKRAHQDTIAESPLSKRSKLTAHVDIECQTPSTTTTSTENSFGELFIHKYDMKYMCNHSPRVKAVDIWRGLSTNTSPGRSRSRREPDTPPRNTDDRIQSAQEGLRFKGCKCSAHQGMYDNWPEYDAELTIAQCMRTCVYCGNSFRSASEVRRHLRRDKYAEKNIRVYQAEPGQLNPTTPSWTPRLKIIDPN
jgi:hypothetical protein